MKLLIVISLLFSMLFNVKGMENTNIESPLTEYYLNYPTARNPWNMTVFDGKLYVASGDYSSNSGRTPIFTYDIEKEEWEEPYLTFDESLEAFRVINGKLVAVGNDSTLASGNGNYYVLENGEWTAYCDLPHANHVFDVVSFDGKTFFGIGVDDNRTSPVLMLDGGEYSEVDFTKDGTSIFPIAEQLTRAYNFFIADGALYAFILKAQSSTQSVQEFYRYNGEAFEFVSERDGDEVYFFTVAVESNSQITNKKITQNFLNYEFTRDGYAYFSTGALFKTNDFDNFERLLPEKGAIITDTVKFGDEYYVLGFRRSKKNEGVNYNIVWRLETDDSFTFITGFSTEGNYALSLAVGDGSIFVGLGNRATADGVGKIYRIKRS